MIGLAGLIAMARLIGGAFGGGPHLVVWAVTAVVMLGWVGYAGWRARRSNLTGRPALVVLLLGLAGSVLGWLFVGGAVAALACSLAGFAVIWWHDRPVRTRLPISFRDS